MKGGWGKPEKPSLHPGPGKSSPVNAVKGGQVTAKVASGCNGFSGKFWTIQLLASLAQVHPPLLPLHVTWSLITTLGAHCHTGCMP